jgi:hypothetical protein
MVNDSPWPAPGGLFTNDGKAGGVRDVGGGRRIERHPRLPGGSCRTAGGRSPDWAGKGWYAIEELTR